MIRTLNYFLYLSFLSCFSLTQSTEDADTPASPTQGTPETTTATEHTSEKKESLIIDARRLTANFKDTILKIKGNPNERFMLMNVSINFGDTLSQLNSLKEEQVLDRFDKISFVMTDKDHMTLDETVFIASILPLLGNIQVLELECWGVSDKVVAAIAENCPRLTKLYLFGPSITDTTMDVLVTKLPNLKKLHLINTNLMEKGASKIDETFKGLYTLGISGKKLEDEDLIVVVEGMKNLHTLSISGQAFKDVKKIDLLVKAASQVKDFDLSDTNIADDSIKTIIDNMKHLDALNISHTPLGKDGVKEAIENLDLKTFIIDGIKDINDEELKLISEHQQKLEKFHFSGADFTDFGIMDVIQNLPDLQDLTLVPPRESKWVLTDAVGAAMAFHLKKLKYLHIEASRLPDNLRKWIAENMPGTNIEYV